MIKATNLEWTKRAFFEFESRFVFPRKFKTIKLANDIQIAKDHSVLLLQNHFSWWDGFLGSYLAYKYLNKSYHVMVQEDQLSRHWYMRYKGAFSIKKNSREIMDSLDYTRGLLENPKNMVLIFPQGRLQSMHAGEITIERGVFKLLDKIESKCQVVYSAVTVEFLESFKPSVTFNLLDLGSTADLNTDELNERINSFHRQAREGCVRP